ncbi:hypothetical protein BCR35DRAFT_330052 [Leucosporidium creatinivorum]|uniref:Glycosyltransferase family 32 protein n=1 Tax=Leucosporidium creatinivorum TaxID=106004 RepID=A0A1Y2FWV8_9BASI|nr:hypothetical protein BCR35DRAFT_330052 [Leucosporidium creatinivorum]
MPSKHGTHSPLPSFHAPTPPRSGSSTPNPYGGASPPNGAVAEKVALSYSRARAGGAVRRVGEWFVPLRIPLGGGGSIAAGGRREIVLPVFSFLHPSRPLPGFNSAGASLSSKRRDSSHPASITLGPNSPIRTLLALLGTAFLLILLALTSHHVILRPLSHAIFQRRSLPFTEPNTLILPPAELERIWRWEIAEGHYPSRRAIGVELGKHWLGSTEGGKAAPVKVENPGLPRRSDEEQRREKEVQAEVKRRLEGGFVAQGRGSKGKTNVLDAQMADIVPVGPSRSYISLPVTRSRKNVAYPPRPQRQAVLDLDQVMEHCDFATGRYVRDCLEVLRVNAGMEEPLLRRGELEAWRMSFVGSGSGGGTASTRTREAMEKVKSDLSALLANSTQSAFASLLAARQQLTLTSPSSHHHTPHPSHPTADPSCDPSFPHIFHIFWAGPFTDKPYSAALSFLYSQNLALSSPIGAPPPSNICRPQLWIWINPGPASSLPDRHAVAKMRRDLSRNPWSAPLLHRRFEETIKFRLWNTTEQLDGVEEMKGWREMGLFNSGGVKYGAEPEVLHDDATTDDLSKRDDSPSDSKVAEAELEELADGLATHTAEAALSHARQLANNSSVNATALAAPLPTKAKDELFERVGSTSQKYDRLTVVLSDMARFVLTHRFGGVYLDADTLLLRDWTELFGWKGAFAYRWSRLEKYNTAVLKMQRGSALGNFIFRTAVANGLDFHPMTVSRYTKDAGLEGLLLRLPDALFDPAWLNTEYYQRDRPPFPYLKRFEEFFETPKDISAAPAAVGFNGFFQGAFSYHYHNGWWMPFDPARNFPDLGPRFSHVERLARGRLLAAKLAALPPSLRPTGLGTSIPTPSGPSPTKPNEQPGQPTGGLPGQKIVGPTGGAKRSVEEQGPRWGDDERDFDDLDWSDESVEEDERDLSWSATLKRTFEAFLRGDAPNMYGEWISWEEIDGEVMDEY